MKLFSLPTVHLLTKFYFFPDEYVAQFKFTVLLMPNGPHRITGITFDPETCESNKKVEDLDIQVRISAFGVAFSIDFEFSYLLVIT